MRGSEWIWGGLGVSQQRGSVRRGFPFIRAVQAATGRASLGEQTTRSGPRVRIDCWTGLPAAGALLVRCWMLDPVVVATCKSGLAPFHCIRRNSFFVMCSVSMPSRRRTVLQSAACRGGAGDGNKSWESKKGVSMLRYDTDTGPTLTLNPVPSSSRRLQLSFGTH